MTEWTGRRAYTQAEPTQLAGNFGVRLDEALAETPAGRELLVPSSLLARAMAVEWAAQGEQIEPATLPLSCLAATALDRVGPRRGELERITIMFGVTDLLCYRAEGPDALVQRELREWQPLLDWASEWLGGRLAVTSGVLPVNQSQAVLDGFDTAVAELDDFTLTAVSAVAAAAKSLIIALALKTGHIDGVRAADLALLDERFQLERWGEDGEAAARHQRVVDDIADAERFLALLAVAP